MGFRATVFVTVSCLFSLGCDGTFGNWEQEDFLQDSTWLTANCGLAVNASFAAVCAEDAGRQRLVTVFRRRSSGLWQKLQQIFPQPGATEQKFGEAVAFDGKWLAIGGVRVGSTSANLPAGERMGYVDVYRSEIVDGATGYVYQRTIEAFPTWGEVDGPEFGTSLAINGGTLVVGARLSSNSIGRALVFDIATGDQTAVLSEYTGNTDEHYGAAVDAASGRLAISKPQGCSDINVGSVCSGEVYVYHQDAAGAWVSELVLSPQYPSDPSVFYRDGFGAAVALGSDWLAVADNDPDAGEPSVYVYRRASGSESWTYDSSFEAVSVTRYGLMGRGSTLAVGDQGGTREDTDETVSRVRVYRISETVDLDAQIIMPSLEFAERVDLYGLNLVVSSLVSPPNAMAFHFVP